MNAKDLRSTVILFVVMMLVTGLAYPLLVTGIASLMAPQAAAGSFVARDGETVGSTLIGQTFTDPKHFWGRPSATSPVPTDPTASSGSNLGPTNPALLDAVRERIAALRAADPDNTAPVPVDLVSASASGLDPEISPAAAYYQAPRVARARGIDRAQLDALIAAHTAGRTFGILGEPRVNVLALNLALDAAH